MAHHYHSYSIYSMCVHSINIHWVMIASVWLQDTGDTNTTPVLSTLVVRLVFVSLLMFVTFSLLSLSLPPSYCHQLAVLKRSVITSTSIHVHRIFLAYTTNSELKYTMRCKPLLEPDFTRYCTLIHGIHSYVTYQLSVHVVSLLLCFFLLVFPCSVSSGFIVVLPRKPGKVTLLLLWLDVWNLLPVFSTNGALSSLLSVLIFCYNYILNNDFKKRKEEAVHCGFATCKQVSPSSSVPAVICLVLSVTNCTMWSQRQWHGWSGN